MINSLDSLKFFLKKQWSLLEKTSFFMIYILFQITLTLNFVEKIINLKSFIHFLKPFLRLNSTLQSKKFNT
ncbi:MAG: hypothetical protein CBC60_06690 [Betaproteobacteria bacterium TMED100]|nr:MAG: hypothetical protein CBC60_06690 [Betaproteobacteria bacterium TMED100]